MIRDAIELLHTTAQQAAGAKGKVEILTLPGEPPHIYGVVRPDGTLERYEATPKPIAARLDSIEQVAGFVADAKGRHIADPTVWYAEDGVTVVLRDGGGDEGDRRDRAAVPLAMTPEFALLRELAAKPRKMDHKQFIQMLRRDLADCLTPEGETLLRTIRAVNFKSLTTGHAQREHGRESLGREIESSIESQFGDIPDQIVLQVRIYDDPTLRVRRPIRCVVEIEPLAQEFALLPLPLSVEDALQDQLADIGTRLEASVDCPVFFGTP